MRRWILALTAALALIALGTAQRADARVHARIGVGFYRPAPVYVVPEPVYYAPYPRYYDEPYYYRPVYYRPYPRYYDDDDDDYGWGPAWSVGLSFGGHRHGHEGRFRGHAYGHRGRR